MIKKNNYLFHVLGIVLFALCLVMASACDNCEDPTNPECENYDPCWGMEEPIVDFEMGEIYGISGGDDILFPSDTVGYGTIYFNAIGTGLEDVISYQWKVGTDTRTWNESSFSLVFSRNDSSTLRNNPVLVTLVTTRRVSPCFPKDDGKDTISRYLHFRAWWEYAFWGTWEGYLDNMTNNIYQLKIGATKRSDLNFYDDVFIYNQYGIGTDCFHIYRGSSYTGYRNFRNGSQGTEENWAECGSPYRRWNREFKVAVNTADDTVVITWEEWHYKDNGSGACCEVKNHIFRGKRVP